MSEYQRYEFMTCDRPLTREQLDAVETLSSHIHASATHAVIEYHWGDFKHNPIQVLYEFFDGFLYWANWGAPRLALRFPHGALPADLIDDYDLDDYVAFTRHKDYDVLDFNFGELEAPDEWIDYDLDSLIAIREELLGGDPRSLYIAWLACESIRGEEEEEEYEIAVPPVPPDFGKLTAAQQVLADLLQVPEDQLTASARHSQSAAPSPEDDFAAWIELLPPASRRDYLLRLAHNEAGLSRKLVKELRDLGQDKTRAVPEEGVRVTYATLLAESRAIAKQWEREEREQKRLARLRHLQDVHAQQEDYWQQINQVVVHAAGANYDKAVSLLVDLREAAAEFNETQAFEERFRAWIQQYPRRPGLRERLQRNNFAL